jgi:hypothetical protein
MADTAEAFLFGNREGHGGGDLQILVKRVSILAIKLSGLTIPLI